MSILRHNFAFGLRTLVRKPGFSLMILGMLALGIAANTIIFSIYNGLFLRPLPFPDPERLVDMDERAPRWNLEFVSVAYPDFHEWRKENRAFEGMAVWDDNNFNLAVGDGAERVRGIRATYDLATVLGVEPILGRNIREDEDQPQAERVALLSHGLWQRRFGGREDVLGSTVKLDSLPYTIVGVLPPRALFPEEAEVWVPLGASPTEQRGWYLSGVGRLKRGISLEQALDDLTRIHKNMIESRSVNEITFPRLMPLRERYLGDYRSATSLLLGAVGVVLLIACVNVAGLMLARGAGRHREMGIRVALGAGTRRLAGQLFCESLLFSGVAVLIGIAFGYGGLRYLKASMPEGLPGWITYDFDPRFFAFCIVILLASATLSGLAPAVQATRVDVNSALQATGIRASASAARRRGLSVLMVVEVALALTLLINAGLLYQAFSALQNTDPGFDAENVLAYTLSLPSAKYEKDEQVLQFFDELHRRQRSLPGVTAVGGITATPMGGDHWGNFFEIENTPPKGPDEQDPVILMRMVTPRYAEAIGLRLREGRWLTEQDGRTRGGRSVVVNQTFSDLFWPSGGALGKRIRLRGASEDAWMTVVGVTQDVKHYGLDREMRPGVYIPFRQYPVRWMTVLLRSTGDPGNLTASARAIVNGMDPELPLYGVTTMSEQVRTSLWLRRSYSLVFTIFAVIALLLAVGGIYGVISYSVSQRTHEIGIRMALGAGRAQVLRLVLRQGMLLVSAGVLVGLAIAAWSARFIETLLLGVSSRDPLVYSTVSLSLLLVGVLANLVPAWKAALSDPTRALRAE